MYIVCSKSICVVQALLVHCHVHHKVLCCSDYCLSKYYSNWFVKCVMYCVQKYKPSPVVITVDNCGTNSVAFFSKKSYTYEPTTGFF